MFDVGFVEERRLSAEAAGELARAAVQERRPFSFVRMNDGEAIILGAYREFDEAKVNEITTHWWGHADYSHDEIEALRGYLLDAAGSADLFGSFDAMDPHKSRWTMAGQLTRKYATLREDQHFCWPDAHYAWQAADYFGTMLEGVRDLTYISAFDVDEGLINKFELDSVRRIAIPVHATAGATPLEAGEAQYPVRFREVVEELRDFPAGGICLVGAGVVGKYYCHMVKQAGGVALDIGSVFDFWVGNRKRRSVRKRASRVGF